MNSKSFPHPREVLMKGRSRVCYSLISSEKLIGKTFVDIGCSYGWLEFLLKDKKLKKMVGIDPSESAIDNAKKNCPYAQFHVSTADNIPVGNNFADFATLFDVIEHVPVNGELKALKEINRALKKGGKLFLSTPNNNFLTNLLDPAWYLGHRHYKPETIRKFLEKSGFSVEKLEVRGGLWFSIYLLWFYFNKWILGNIMPRSTFLEEMDDKQFDKKGIHTIFAVARKL